LARFLALDWDQNQLHLIAANQRGASIQVQRASVCQEGQALSPATAEELGNALRERLKEAGIAAAPVLACVPRDRVIVKEVRFPAVPEPEEPAVVRFQTVKELTDAAEDVVIDYVVTGQEANGEKKAAVLIVRRDVLQTYQTLCQTAGLKLVGLTPRLIGISHCLRKIIGTTVVTPPPDPADGAIAVVVVGEKTAEFCVLRGSNFLLTRSLSATSNLAGDIRRNLAVHAGQSPQHKVCAVYVSGKGSGELRERLADLVEIPVHTFDPFAGAETLDLPVGQRGGFAGAMGLLFVRAEGDLPINFVSPRQPRPPQNFNYRLARLAIVASVALFLGVIILGQLISSSIADDFAGVKEARLKVEADVAKTKIDLTRLKLLVDWEQIVDLDELYDLAARIPDVDKLRIKSISIDPLPRAKDAHFVAKLTIKGELRNPSNLREPLDKLIPQFTKDGYYSPQPPKVESNIFTLEVFVERRPPEEYKHVLAEPKTPGKANTRTHDEDEESAASDEEDTGKGRNKGRSKGKRRGRE
jgi:Tfp pilus assembly PilM family ATPase